MNSLWIFHFLHLCLPLPYVDQLKLPFFWMIKGFKKSTGLPDVKKDMR